MVKPTIKVYDAEKTDGLESAVASQSSVAYNSLLLIDESPEGAAAAELAVGTEHTFDLFPVNTILVTIGSNKNDDIFDVQETWAARNSSEDNPFNIGHEPRKIIGHITGNAAVDDNYDIIPDTTHVSELPDKFHILTSAVIYRHISSKDEELEAEAAEIIEGVKKGDWYVSMECLFTDFDYGVTTASGDQKIIRRDNSTAFLTKHLRIYGGSGEYNGSKIGRVLRNITFSGKGLVENPANPESIIFNDTSKFEGVFATLNECEVQKINKLETDMDEKYTETLEDNVKTLQSDLAAANKRIEELGEANIKATLSEKDVRIAELEKGLAAADEKIEEVTASYNEAVKTKEEIEIAKAEVDAKLAEASEKLETVAHESLVTSRVSSLVDKGVGKDKAEEVVAEFSDLTDDKFEKIIEMQASLIAVTEETPKEEEVAEGAEASEEVEEDSAGEESAEGAELESAETDNDADMASAEEGQDETIRSSIAAYFDEVLASA